MATLYPDAEFDPLGPQTEPRMAAHDIVCLHTMAATFAGTDSGFHANGYGGLESHFGISGSGRVKQWQDLDFQADANFNGNPRVISIETADKGEMFPAWSGSDVPPWTDAQLDQIVPLVRWLCDTFDIPKQLVPDSKPGRRGIAYHRLGVPHSTHDPNAPGGPWLGPGGELWTHPEKGLGKVCPGDRRIAQLKEIVIPRVQGSGEDDMPLNSNDIQQIRDAVRLVLNEGTGQGQREWAGTMKATLDNVQDIARQVGELNRRMSRMEARLGGD
jgi:hypothetical protein